MEKQEVQASKYTSVKWILILSYAVIVVQIVIITSLVQAQFNIDPEIRCAAHSVKKREIDESRIVSRFCAPGCFRARRRNGSIALNPSVRVPNSILPRDGIRLKAEENDLLQNQRPMYEEEEYSRNNQFAGLGGRGRENLFSSAQGPSGFRGKAGQPGGVGSRGSPGSRGLVGSRGLDGAPGSLGQLGHQGPSGAPGVTGARGSPGISGVRGSPGGNGAQGYSGASGLPGARGSPGISGASGNPGLSGTPGSSGYNNRISPTNYYQNYDFEMQDSTGRRLSGSRGDQAVHEDHENHDNNTGIPTIQDLRKKNLAQVLDELILYDHPRCVDEFDHADLMSKFKDTGKVSFMIMVDLEKSVYCIVHKN